MNEEHLFQEIVAAYLEMEKRMRLALEKIALVRRELSKEEGSEGEEKQRNLARETGREELFEMSGRLLKMTEEAAENMEHLRKAFIRASEIEKRASRRAAKLFAEDYVPYPEPVFGISRFASLSAHEALLPFEKQTETEGESLGAVEIW